MNFQLKSKYLKSYWPFILVLLFIIGGVFHFGWLRGNYDLWMADFMGLFFLVFSFFKFLNINAFARAYRRYDIPTNLFPVWGYVYPFVEFGLAIMYLHRIKLDLANILTVIVLGISIMGVIKSVLNKQEIKCACLGTGFNLPMTQVTIIEDGTMILMALIMIFT